MKSTRKTSPFKDKTLLETEIKSFINKFKKTVQTHSDRISDYFEMACFNHVVQFYEKSGYTVEIDNLQNGEYRYKCSTSGIQKNFSNFKASKFLNGLPHEFEIQHNLAIQSSHDQELFTTPDITVIKSGQIKSKNDYYDTLRTFSYVENSDMLTFFEVKHFNPYPELVFNFIGTVNELRKEIISNTSPELNPSHLAPSLLTSGKPNKQTQRIKDSLERRYCLNIIYDLFSSGTTTFSKGNLGNLRKAGTIP